MEKIEINDLVVVRKDGETYTTNKTFVEQAKKENKNILLKNWLEGKLPAKNVVHRVIYQSNDKALIENKEGKFYIIGKDGIKPTLKIGQRVCFSGEKGRIKTIEGNYSVGDIYKNPTFGVVFDIYDDERHNLSGCCQDGYGWYCNLSDLQIIDEETQPEEPPAIIKEEIVEDSKTGDSNENIDKLTKEISKLTKEIHKKERMQDLLNEAIIEKGKDIAIEDLKQKLEKDLDNFIEEKYGILPKTIELVKGDIKRTTTGIFHKEFENICRIVDANIPLMLVGSAGAGKNYTLEQVADALDLDFYFSNAVNQEYKLTGFIDANGVYHETQFYQAFTKGGMFFLDEIDASCPECLVILNSAIANRYFDFPTGRAKAHENFRVVCAGNTYGTGADMVYVGRNVLDGATLDRFVVLEFGYDEQVEKQLAYDEDLYNFITALRKAINDSNLRYIVSMRALINSTKLLELGIDKKSILKTTIIKNMQIDDLNTIASKVSENCHNDWVVALKEMTDNVRN